MKPIYLILIGIVIFIVGFFIGRVTNTESIVTKYVKGATIHDSISIPVPYSAEIPVLPILPTKHDTLRINSKEYVILKVDTAKIIANYILRKRYSIPLFDDNNGKLVVSPVVQYNSLDSLGYTFTPMIKEVTITREKIFTPFINASWNSFGYLGAGGGIYYHDVGVSARYLTNFANTGYEVGVSIKF